MAIHKKDFVYYCGRYNLDPGSDPDASWLKIKEVYCSRLSFMVCPLNCFLCIETIRTLLLLQNTEETDEKMIAYANQITAKMTEDYNKNGNKNPYDNDHPSVMDSIMNSKRDQEAAEAKKMKKKDRR